MEERKLNREHSDVGCLLVDVFFDLIRYYYFFIDSKR